VNQVTGYPAGPVPRRRHPGRGLLIALVVLLLLLVAIDRIGVLVADRAVASKVQSSQNLDRRPSVRIQGFPFLTQVIANHYGDVTLNAHQITLGHSGKRVTLDSLDARLSGVRTRDRFSSATADQVTATGTVGYGQLSQLLGIPLSYAAGGRVQATRSVTVLGQTVRGTVSAVVTVPGGDELGFSDVRVSVADATVGLPQAVVGQLTDAFNQQLSLSGLPFGLRVRNLDVSRDGVSITATASNVTLS